MAITPAGIPGHNPFGNPAVSQNIVAVGGGVPSGEIFGTPYTAVTLSNPLPVSNLNYWPTVVKRYPSGSITPAGAYHLLNNHVPTMKYRSYDNTVVFALMGGEAIADTMAPERVEITDLKGLIPPWQNIVQKGATQDGATYIDSLYDPIEADIGVRLRGRNNAYRRAVQRDWIASWDAKQPGTLSWFTHDLGYWWANMQLAKPPMDKLIGGLGTGVPQKFTWPAIAYNAFWQSYDCVDQFGFQYTSFTDNFDSVTAQGLNGWTTTYSTLGGWLHETNVGYLSVLGIPILYEPSGGIAQWNNDPNNAIPAQGVDAVAINNTFVSTTDDQIVSMMIGSIPTWYLYGPAYNDLWFRCPNPSLIQPGVDGIRLRIGQGIMRLSSFNSSVETLIQEQFLLIPPLPGEMWQVACAGRTYTVSRGYNGALATVAQVTEAGTTSLKGSAYRWAGFGMHVSFETTPAGVLLWTGGDNNITAQSGQLGMVNGGDQPMWPRYTLYGPGTFTIQDGPNNAGENVTMGPLLPGQIVQMRTDPRKRGVTDLTSQPASPQALTLWQQALEDFLNFADANNTTPLVTAIESAFGIAAPQGNIYSLLNGRFSDHSAIPARAANGTMTGYEIPVSISGGNANSAIVAAGTPLRRFPY